VARLGLTLLGSFSFRDPPAAVVEHLVAVAA